MIAVVVWARHQPARSWCAVIAASDGAARTACRGSWGIGPDGSHGPLVETHPAPAKHERCDECQRQLIELVRIERGLAELVANAPTLGPVGASPAARVETWPVTFLEPVAVPEKPRPAARPIAVFDLSDVDVGGIE